MPKLSHEVKIKKENHGTFRHDYYKIVIPYKISQELGLQDSMILHATASKKTRIMRFHKKPLQDSTPVKIRHKLTKTYKNVKYYSTRITIPVQFIRDLEISDYKSFQIDYHKDTLIIQPERR